MAADKEAVGLSRVHIYEYKCILPLFEIIGYSVLKHIYTTMAALSAKICPQNRTDFYPYGLNSTPIIA